MWEIRHCDNSDAQNRVVESSCDNNYLDKITSKHVARGKIKQKKPAVCHGNGYSSENDE